MLGCLGVAAVVTISGACSGGTQTPSTTPFDPGAPLVRFATSHFAGSGNCAQCHSNLTDASGHDVSIDTAWRSTMMANAAKDPYFLAKTASEIAGLPALKNAIEDACSTCHMPMARTQAISDGTEVSMLGSTGFLSTSNPLNKAALDGNSCTLCHQIQDKALGTPDAFEGKYAVDTSTAAPNRIEFGPFAAPLTGPMQAMVGFTPAQGSQVGNAGLCATCHTVYTPIVDDKGAVVGNFPEQTAYLEWQNSIYGNNPAQQLACQSCHMPAAGGAAISNNPTTLAPRSPFYRHDFIGGSAFILNIMGSRVQDLGISASTEQMTATAQLTSTQLATRSAQVSVVNSGIENGVLKVTLSITDQTGHKFPTGFPSRRTWIQFTVTDSTGKVVFESGKPNADGSISGNDADSKTGNYEPHYDIITSSDQVQIYESIMGDTDGKVTYNLLRGESYLKDNRLLPSGFNKATAPADAGVYGNAVTDANFAGGSDQVTYQISPGGKGPYTITVRLLYQTESFQFSKAFIGTDALVKAFLADIAGADKTPNLVAAVSKTLG
jgi:hypothetical protein